MKLLALMFGIVFTLVTPLAFALSSGYYGVIDVGQSTATKACDTSLMTYGGSSNFTCTDKATSWGPSIGYQFNDNFAIEGGYLHIGTFSYSYDTTACAGCTVASSQKYSELRFAVIGYLPPSNNFSLFGKAGFNRWYRTNTGNELTVQQNFSDNSGSLVAGFGVKYELNKNLAVRAQFETQGIGGKLSRADMLSIGLIFQ